ncbi:MAG: 16S rRNA (cytidine(1402)-2'-O)-methyltransferase [FCB group bacterium]|nr:16S rRNA (cytidine(1402)-2'-O)-methyltransferase [FCB group bacterium]
MARSQGKIYLIPTPIGNMDDITKRAIKILEDVDLIACEDTRHSGLLLKKLGIKKKLISYHNFNEESRSRQLIQFINEGLSVGVITDAGSPGISDPAYRVVKTAVDNNIEIIPLPGATAIIPALTASGLPTDRFFFEGFLPHKSGARKNKLTTLKDLPHTLVFYESPHRIEKTLHDLLETLGNRDMCLARELTKKFEQFMRGTVNEVLALVQQKKIKGEIVLVVEGQRNKKQNIE